MICYERSAYTEKEKQCLKELLRKYGMNDVYKYMGNLSAKQEAWANLTKEFNAIKGNKRRTQAQLRKFWSNHRSRIRTPQEAEKTLTMHVGAKLNPDTVNTESETSSAGVDLLMDFSDLTETASDAGSQQANNCSSEDSVGMFGRPFFTEKEKLYLEMLVRKYSLQDNTSFKGSVLAKRQAWARLAKEFNSKAYTTRRSERQLKKCWDNLKARKKNRMVRLIKAGLLNQSEVESPESEIPCAVTAEAGEDPLESHKEDKLIVNFETTNSPEESPSDALEFLPPEMVQEQMLALNIKTEPTQTSAPSSVGDNDHSETQEFGPMNNKRIEEREDELHRLRVAERKWLVKAAEEAYIKARIERESAEELLRFRKAKRAEAERNMNKLN